MAEQTITIEQFLHDPDKYLGEITQTNRVIIGKKAVLIHPKNLHILDQCAELVDDMPIGIESLIDDDDG